MAGQFRQDVSKYRKCIRFSNEDKAVSAPRAVPRRVDSYGRLKENTLTFEPTRRFTRNINMH